MEALSTLRTAKNFGSIVAMAALITITPLVYPEFVLAASSSQNEGQNALVFEINDPSVLNTKTSITLDNIVKEDPIVPALKQYLADHDSPLADYSEEIVKLPRWQLALSVSWVESNFGKYCYDNNCSGIGVAPGHPSWRKYPDKLAWFKDLSDLLQKPLYKDKYDTCKKMRGIYVYPGSNNWVWGCEQKLNELNELTENAQTQRIAASNQQLAMAQDNQ